MRGCRRRIVASVAMALGLALLVGQSARAADGRTFDQSVEAVSSSLQATQASGGLVAGVALEGVQSSDNTASARPRMAPKVSDRQVPDAGLSLRVEPLPIMFTSSCRSVIGAFLTAAILWISQVPWPSGGGGPPSGPSCDISNP